LALALSAGASLRAQTRVAGAINFNESCCAIGMRGPSVPANSNRLVIAVTNSPNREFHHHDGFRHDGFRHDHFRNRGIGGFGGGYIYYNPYGYYDTQTMDDSQAAAANNYEQPVDDEGPGLTVFEHRRDYQLIGDSPQYQREQQDQRYGEHYTDSREQRARGDNDSSAASNKETSYPPVAAPEQVVSTI